MAEIKATHHGKLQGRQVVTALGILLLTFGVFGWQWRAFSQRNSETIVENQTIDQSAEVPPPNTHWHEAPPKARLAVAACIRGQLDAFRGGEYEAGLRYHSQAVRGQMPTTQDYQQLIETRYPSLLQWKKATFRFINTDKERRFANAGVSLVGADGGIMEAVYQLVFQDKQWLISGIAKRPPQLPASRKP